MEQGKHSCTKDEAVRASRNRVTPMLSALKGAVTNYYPQAAQCLFHHLFLTASMRGRIGQCSFSDALWSEISASFGINGRLMLDLLLGE